MTARKGGAFLDPYVQLGVGALLVTASELLLKKGATAVAGGGGWLGFAALGSVWTWAGIATYILSFVSWLYVLGRLPLGIAFALINVVHVLVPLGSWLILGETISRQRWCGIAAVVAGTLMVARSSTREERSA